MNKELLNKYKTFPEPDLLTKEEIEVLLPDLDAIIAWAKQLQEYALQQALNGVKFKGWKVVEGRSNRKFRDEEKVAQKLLKAGYSEDQIYRVQLETLTNLERVVGKAQFNLLLGDLIYKPPGKPALVPESDKRPPYDPNIAAAADFADE